MKRFALILSLLLGAGAARADDVGNAPDSAEPLSTGSVTRLIERYDDVDFFRIPVLPFVTNVVTVSTGTVWDCEMELYTPAGVSVLFTNAIDAPTAVQLFNTSGAQRAYLSVKSLAEFTTGTYDVVLSQQFTDLDGDGLPDAWELEKFGSLTNATAGGDADDDGFSDCAEWLAGTHPNDAASALRIQKIQIVTNWAAVTWSSLPESLYRVSSATNPFGSWVEQPQTVLAESNSTSREVTGVPTTAVFRVELLY